MSFSKCLNGLFAIALCLALSVAVPLGAFAKDKYENSYDDSRNDPLESINRNIFEFNMVVDKFLLKPAAKVYRAVLPKVARKGVRNVASNLTEPVTFVNSVLQGDVENSFTSFWRFFLNSTIGIGGLFDIATTQGLEHRKEDFGQTAGTYGVKPGPYVVLPLLGPSSTRDVFGRIVDAFTDPFNYALDTEASIVRHAVEGVDTREAHLDLVDELSRISFDLYATTRSLYGQKRVDDIRNGNGRFKE